MPAPRSPQRQPRVRRRHYIRQWREFRGKTQQEVADYVGLDESSIGRIEDNKQNFTWVRLQLIAEFLDTTPEALLTVDPFKAPIEPSVIDQLRDDERREVSEFARYVISRRRH